MTRPARPPLGDVREVAVSVVPQQPVAGRVRERGREDRREKEVEAPVAVEVRRDRAAAVLVGAEARRIGPVGEAAGTVAPEKPRLVEVGDDGEVGQPSPSKSVKRVVNGNVPPCGPMIPSSATPDFAVTSSKTPGATAPRLWNRWPIGPGTAGLIASDWSSVT